MIDPIGPVSFQSSPSRPAGDSPAPAPARAQDLEVVTSRIRVDNARNVAFLEYISPRTGQVVRQYPSEKQIQAFRQAEKIVAEARKPSTAAASPSVEASEADVALAAPLAPTTPVPSSEASAPPAPTSDAPAQSILV